MSGSPMKSHDRHLNKIFDKGRVKMKANGKCTGCDLDYQVREQVMQVGKVTRGALKNMSDSTAEAYHKNIDIDQKS